MTSKQGLKDFSWAAGGMVLLIVVGMLAWRGHREEDTASRAAFKAKRVELVGRLRASLSSASEAEMGAVMATTDEESRVFADRARAASATAAQTRDELAKLLETGSTRNERDLLSQASRGLDECRHIDSELLDLAVRNTNLKAYVLAFGPAAAAIADVDVALSHILSQSAVSMDTDAKQVMLLAAGAQSGAWRIQALLPPHISEESDQKMDSLETRMAAEDRAVLSDLKKLTSLRGSGNPDLETAKTGYARFTELRTQILDLSRQNTNVRSLIISLNQKRRAVQICQDALSALEQAIQEEPLAEEEPVNPR